VTEATNAATEATKKLKHELAGFDQITKLGGEDSSSSGSNASSSTGTSSPSVDDGTAEKVSKLSEKYTKLAESIGNLKDKFEPFINLLQSAGKWVYDNVLKPLGEWAMNEYLPAYFDYFAGILRVLTSACKLLQPVWQWLWDNLFSKMANFVGTAMIAVLKEFAWRLNALAEGMDTLAADIQGIPDKIAGIKESVKQKWDEVKSGVTGKVVDFKAKVATKWDDLKADWKKLKANATGKTADIKLQIATKWKDLKSSWNTLLGKFNDKAVSITLKIKGTVADMKKWFNESVIDKVNAKIHKVPFLENVSIPRLAQGGFVKKNTPQLAMIGDNRHYGEIVAPENKLQEMARMAAAGAGGSSPEVIALLREIVELLKALDLDVTIDGNSLMQLIVRLINQQTKSTGKCPVMV
ncbi:MAG: hypothetical protein IKU44_05610, partial [Firmicutes bacterium]|nr:hypothetical protein [Bacillota bacterium]